MLTVALVVQLYCLKQWLIQNQDWIETLEIISSVEHAQ